MVQVRVLAAINVGELIDMDEAKAWAAHERGKIAFKTEEDGLMAAIAAGEPYHAPEPPPAAP